jgi:hypothetical protein
VQANQHTWCTFREREAPPSHSNSKIQDEIQTLIEDKLEEPNRAFAQAGDKVAINRLMKKWICVRFGAEFPSL